MRGEIAKAWLQSMLLFEIRIPVVMVRESGRSSIPDQLRLNREAAAGRIANLFRAPENPSRNAAKAAERKCDVSRN
jgi:hypothetical protein